MSEPLDQLKPCPFCGGPVQLEQTLNRTGWGVVCRNAVGNLGGTCAIEQVPSKEKQAAITRWNTRAIQNEPIQPMAFIDPNGVPYHEVVDALVGMAWQYLENSKGFIDHQFMSAGEMTECVLERLGIVVGEKIVDDFKEDGAVQAHIEALMQQRVRAAAEIGKEAV